MPHRRPALLYACALVLVLAAAALLFVGLVLDAVGTIAISVAASAGALILLWAGVTRSSDPSERDRHS